MRHGLCWLVVLALLWPGTVLADSLWGAAPQETGLGSLYARDLQSFGLGDIVTILLMENTSASNEADLETEKDSQKELEFEGFGNVPLPLGLDDIERIFGRNLAEDPQFGLNSTSDFEGEGESSRSSRVSGTVSAQVVEILANGNLRIEATQAVHINEELNTVVLTGIIRPQDVGTNNTIPSTRIANAEIFYTGRGPLTNVNRRGILTELWEYLWPF